MISFISIEQFSAYFLTALVPSVIGAISGIGGGIIIKPMLDNFFTITSVEINFLSGSTVLAMSLVTLFQNRIKKIKFEDRRGTILALGGIAGGIAGKFSFNAAIAAAAGTFIGTIQSGIMILLCSAAFIYTANKSSINTHNIKNSAFCFILGLVMGMISSFLGIGGGPINIMIISYFLGQDSKSTSLCSLYVICLSQTASLFISVITRSIPQTPPAILITMILGGVIGGIAGTAIFGFMNNKQVDILFKIILAGVIILSVSHFLGSLLLIID